MTDWKLRIGNFLFKYRSFTPLPFILLVFIIFRPGDWGERNVLVNITGLLVSLVGELIRILSVGFAFSGTSGRESFLRADNLNVSGIYSLLRNPLYFGNFLIFTGIVIVFSNPFALVLFSLFLIMQYYFVVLAEENYLRAKYGDAYETYCKRVNRIIPTFKGFRSNENPFNPKKVLFKENDSLFNLLVMYLLVLLYKERFFTGMVQRPWIYIVAGCILVVVYVTVKILKKRGTA